MDLGQITLTQMRYAVAVEELQNFRLAAQRCHVSQSGLSMQIQRLEQLLDTVLFDRRKKPVLVTPRGQVALSQIRSVLRETERLGQLVSEDDELSGRFRLGVIPTLAPTVLPLLLQPFVQAFPRVELKIEELKTDELVSRLQADTLDAGLAATPLSTDGLREELVARESLFAYLPPGDVLLEKKRVRQADLGKRELWVMPEGHCFRTQVLAYCSPSERKAPARIHFESGSFETLVRLVDGGLGATVLPALVIDSLLDESQRRRARPLFAPVPVREIGLVATRTDFRRRVRNALLEVARNELQRALIRPPRNPLVLNPMAKQHQVPLP